MVRLNKSVLPEGIQIEREDDYQRAAATNLKNRLSRHIRDFIILVNDYKAERDPAQFDIIYSEISRKSEFAAFKRKIVRDDPELSEVFAEALE